MNSTIIFFFLFFQNKSKYCLLTSKGVVSEKTKKNGKKIGNEVNRSLAFAQSTLEKGGWD